VVHRTGPQEGEPKEGKEDRRKEEEVNIANLPINCATVQTIIVMLEQFPLFVLTDIV